MPFYLLLVSLVTSCPMVYTSSHSACADESDLQPITINLRLDTVYFTPTGLDTMIILGNYCVRLLVHHAVRQSAGDLMDIAAVVKGRARVAFKTHKAIKKEDQESEKVRGQDRTLDIDKEMLKHNER